jgi:fructose-1,6-bisphosphatase/inositol monophosphatase family enzyme
MAIDYDAVTALMREVAAAEILPRFRKLAPADVRQKEHPADLVTVADIEAERALGAGLTTLLPGSRVLGEEAAARDPGLLALLGSVDPVWLIDPVDGTQNFVEGVERFAVIIGLCESGRTVAGWVLDPIGGSVVWAGIGTGAWLEGAAGREPLSVVREKPLSELKGCLDYRSAKRLKAAREAGLSPSPSLLHRQRCTGHEYIDLAMQRIDFAQYRRLKPWDHAAGVLIHAEAGGFSRLRGTARPYRPDPAIIEEPLLLAPDECAWQALDDVVR